MPNPPAPTAPRGRCRWSSWPSSRANHERLFAYVFSLLPRRADAEDVFQRTSLTLWQKFEQWDRVTPFLSWACGVAFYQVRNFVRVASRDRLQFSDDLLARLSDE